MITEKIHEYVTYAPTIKGQLETIDSLINYLHELRLDISHNYVLCDGCNNYVRKTDRILVDKTNHFELYCPRCNKLLRWELK